MSERYHTDDATQKLQWWERLDAVPHSVLPDGPARVQLEMEIMAGDLVDAYASPLAPVDFQGWNIERPTPGRVDSRWPAVEWIAFVESGMVLTPCGICNNVPALFMTDTDRDLMGQRVPLCYACNAALTATGHRKHYYVNCSECGRPGIAYEATETLCQSCMLAQHLLKRSRE